MAYLLRRNYLPGRGRKIQKLKRQYHPQRGGGMPHGYEPEDEEETPPDPEPGVGGSPIGLLLVLTQAS
jgi:hypothetical protein